MKTLVRFAFVLAAAGFLSAGCKGKSEQPAADRPKAPATSAAPAAHEQHPATVPAAEQSAAKLTQAQTTCPIMKRPIDKQFFADYQGKRVYFCCSACVKEFEKDPAKYVKKLEDAGVEPEKAPPG